MYQKFSGLQLLGSDDLIDRQVLTHQNVQAFSIVLCSIVSLVHNVLMKKIILCLFFASLVIFVRAQDSTEVAQYFDKDWAELPDKNGAAFYRTILETDETILVNDYFISGELQMEAMCSSIKPIMMREGVTIFYYKNGKMKEHSNYADGQLLGNSKTFYENGSPKRDLYHTMNKKIYIQAWSEDGSPLIKNGSALIKEVDKATNIVNHIKIKDSLAISAYYTTPGSADTVYTEVEALPEYKGGLEAMTKDIRTSMTYPKSARRNNISGTVYIQFIVNEKGEVTNCKVLKGIDWECDVVALKAVANLKKWKPGVVEGKPVLVRFVLPILFKLK
jgi:TonB family protein